VISVLSSDENFNRRVATPGPITSKKNSLFCNNNLAVDEAESPKLNLDIIHESLKLGKGLYDIGTNSSGKSSIDSHSENEDKVNDIYASIPKQIIDPPSNFTTKPNLFKPKERNSCQYYNILKYYSRPKASPRPVSKGEQISTFELTPKAIQNKFSRRLMNSQTQRADCFSSQLPIRERYSCTSLSSIPTVFTPHSPLRIMTIGSRNTPHASPFHKNPRFYKTSTAKNTKMAGNPRDLHNMFSETLTTNFFDNLDQRANSLARSPKKANILRRTISPTLLSPRENTKKMKEPKMKKMENSKSLTNYQKLLQERTNRHPSNHRYG